MRGKGGREREIFCGEEFVLCRRLILSRLSWFVARWERYDGWTSERRGGDKGDWVVLLHLVLVKLFRGVLRCGERVFVVVGCVCVRRETLL